jgi:hypothetical protein
MRKGCNFYTDQYRDGKRRGIVRLAKGAAWHLRQLFNCGLISANYRHAFRIINEESRRSMILRTGWCCDQGSWLDDLGRKPCRMSRQVAPISEISATHGVSVSSIDSVHADSFRFRTTENIVTLVNQYYIHVKFLNKATLRPNDNKMAEEGGGEISLRRRMGPRNRR